MSLIKVPLKIHFSRPVAVWAAIGGGLLALLALSAGIVGGNWLPKYFDYLKTAGGRTPSEWIGPILLAFLGGICVLYFFVVGVADCISGARRLLQPYLEVDGPEPFLDYDREVVPGLRDGKLQFFGSLSARLRLLFGPNIVALAPSACEIVVANGNSLISRAMTLPGWLIVVYLNFHNGWDSQLYLPLGLLIGGSILQAGVEYLSTSAMVPTGSRVARSNQASHHYKGFGHPTHLFNRLPILASKLALPDFPNKFYKWGGQDKAGTVRDIGEFGGAVFIERQPLVADSATSNGGLLLLSAGWCLRLAAALLLLCLFAPFADILYPSAAAMSVFIIALIRFYVKGSQYKRQGVTLLDTLQFRSVAIFMAVHGEVSRADIHVGRGQSDSLSSQNVAARSNFTAQFWTGELISEARTVQDRRRLLQVVPTEESAKWLQHFLSEIETLREERVRPVGLDLSSPEANELILANEAIFARRAEAARGLEPSLLVSPMPESPKQLSGENGGSGSRQTPSQGIDEDTKECPDCAEKVRLKAKKCRFCGHQFDSLAGESE